ncbi:MAG: HD domain-containing protein [Candidatus Dojkabacteria bacterium]
MDYIIEAKKIIEDKNLSKFIKILLDHWESEPTSLGHGFSHVLKVAVNAYNFGKSNNYEKPEDIFVGGLFHDVYRPAEDKAGEEDQTKGADVIKELFQKENIDSNLIDKVTGAILSHDSWVGTENPPLYDLILSTADKASHDNMIADSYIWASLKFTNEKNIAPVFKNHLDTLVLFLKYEQRAWSVFKKHPINGTEDAIEAYIKINENTFDAWRKDKVGENFLNYIEEKAELSRNEEIKYLKAFGRSEDSMKKIMGNCY